MRGRVSEIIDGISNLKWDIKFYFLLLLKPGFRSTINSNKKLKNKYTNNRCFIVGNGPSLNKMDLSLLNNEIVFTVNTIMSNTEIYNTLYSDFHVIVDPFYFRQSVDLAEEKAIIDLLKKINYKDKKPECIVSYEGKSAFELYGLSDLLNLNYIYQHRNITDSYSSEIDLCNNIPTTQNVIQSAIFSAIYMGIKEIYLIGCDMTSIFLTYEANDDGETIITNNTHAFKFSEKEIQNLMKESNRLDNEFILHDYAKTFTIFKRIRKFAERNNIEILNATKGGGLDVFKRVQYETLFDK